MWYFAWDLPTALSAHGDLIVFPDMYTPVLLARARYYMWQFKDNLQASAFAAEDYKKGIDHFSKAVGLSELDTLSRYNLLIAEGHLLYKRGNKDGLWDAIQNYHKAAQLKPDLGDPHYYIGQSYHKLGDTDFDLFVESYEMALTLNLSPHLRDKTKAAHARASQRDKLLKDFWK